MMKMYFRMIILFLSLLLTKGADAQESYWQCDTYAYEYDMAVYYALEENSVAVTDLGNYEVAAFVGDECRGVGEVVTSETTRGQTVTFGYLRVHSNSPSGETVTFKCYDKAKGEECDIEYETIEFVENGMVGLPSTPLILAIVTPIPGDANGDGRVTVTDIGIVVNMILQQPVSDYQEEGADANGDSKVTVTDIGAIVDIILGAGSQNARKNDDIKD